ncbi:transcriptional regulator, TetR family [Thermoanaerobacter ethanolicus JW 200]|nr:transcriptional regulator, TetR family [Thermoanaerobacter ethanolicus JW 200]
MSHNNLEVIFKEMPKQTFFNLPEEKRKLITDTLIRYFSQKPYHKVDITDVAKECSVAKGSMYQYFENKKDMYFYSIEMAYSKFLDLLNKINIKQMSIFDYYENSLKTVWLALKSLKDEYILLERAFFFNDSPFKDEINEKFLTKSREFLVEIVKNNQEKGFIRDDINPLIIAIFLEGASFYLKKFVIERAINQEGTSTYSLDIEYFRGFFEQFLKLLKEGLEKE